MSPRKWLRLRVTLAAADDRCREKSQISLKGQSNCESGTDEPVSIALFYTFCSILPQFILHNLAG